MSSTPKLSWHQRNRDRVIAYGAEYRAKHREKARDYAKVYYRENCEQMKEAAKKYYRKHHERDRHKKHAWQMAHPEKRRIYRNRWRSGNTEGNLRRRITDSLRQRIKKVLFRNGKSASTIELLGCSVDSFKIYLESKFEEGMSWSNYGAVWHIDHIMPCAIFDLSKPEHQRRCFHFSNQQPLFKEDNQAKRDKILSDQFNLL